MRSVVAINLLILGCLVIAPTATATTICPYEAGPPPTDPSPGPTDPTPKPTGPIPPPQPPVPKPNPSYP